MDNLVCTIDRGKVKIYKTIKFISIVTKYAPFFSIHRFL